VVAVSALVAPATAQHSQTVRIVIQANGVAAPANIAVAPGVLVRVLITNYSATSHTFTIPGLHVSALVRPGSRNAPVTTVVTFTPHLAGSFAWYCYMCQHGLHGHAHHMGGWIFAVIDPKLLP
jgi:heme/copper-type cytochrome/quinol oxidase subunit 2